MAHSRDEQHTPPQSDELINGMSEHERCGCATPEALIRWFEGYMDDLGDENFKVGIYWEEYARSGRNGQVVFDGNTAQKLDTLRIDDFVGMFA